MSNVAPFRRRAAGHPDLLAERAGGMVVIALASPSGGAGRTMLAAHIAVQAGLTGDGPVGVLDADPKGALFQWWNRRQGKVDAPAFGAHCDPAGLGVTLEGMRVAGARLCVIDTATGDAAALAPVAALAEMVVIPSDAGDMDEAAALGRALAKQTTVAFVFNCRAHSGAEEGNALAAMSAGGGWPAGTVEHSRAYAIAMTAGRSVTESDAGSYAAHDIAELWTNLRGILVAG